MNLRDTIVAISTPLGRAGLGVVRLSGNSSCDIASKFLRFSSPQHWYPRRAQLAELADENSQVIDQAMVTFFSAPRSYTAEDVVEISCHGAPVVLRCCLDRAVQSGARLAEPGEFSLRAFLNGRIDLPQAEAIRELIDATTLYQARIAAQQMNGSVSRRIHPLKQQLLELISLLEAGLDFAEDDVSVASAEEILRRIAPVNQGLKELVSSFRTGRLVFEGFTLAIVGRPNVGKSSLFNRLLQEDRAIVTDIPGTTRDLISETTTMDGLPVKLVDTAGIREGRDLVETLGIERSYQALADADLTMLVLDSSVPLTDEDRQLLSRTSERRPIVVRNKADLPVQIEVNEVLGMHTVSATTGTGINELRAAILRQLAPDGLASPESGAITSMRHEVLLQESLVALASAERAIDYQIPHEMVLMDLYAALQPIDAITGATSADDILNRIFSTFCIGK